MIAFAGPNIPLELLMATGRLAGPIAFDPDRPTPQADTWLESKFAPWSRPVLETWLEGGYDHLDQVLFSRADDTSQRLYYYLCELRRRGHAAGPEPLILDIAKIDRPSSRARTAERLRAMADRLGVGDAALEAAIVEGNRRRAALPASQTKGNEVLLAGTPAPDARLADCVYAAGFTPIGQTLAESWSDPGDLVAEGTADPCRALAEWAHALAGGPRSFANPAAVLADQVARSAARAVILWRIEEDEAMCWHLPAERRALAAAGVPSLVLTRRDWLARDGVAGEIAGFLAGVAA